MTACLIWIGVISAAVVTIVGTTAAIGWIIAGALFLALVLGLMVSVKEVGRATEWPEDGPEFELTDCVSEGGSFSRHRFRANELLTIRTGSGSRGLTVRNRDRVLSRRVSVRQNRPRTSSWT